MDHLSAEQVARLQRADEQLTELPAAERFMIGSFWESATIPSFNIRLEAFRQSLKSPDGNIGLSLGRGQKGMPNSTESMRRFLAGKSSPALSVPSYRLDQFAPSQSEDVQQGLMALGAICIDYAGATDALACTRALSRLIGQMKPVQLQTGLTSIPQVLTGIDLVREILSRRDLHAGAYRSALRVLDEVQQFVQQRSRPRMNLFDTLAEGFRTEGDPPPVADKKASLLLALYGIRGANIAMLHLVSESSNAGLLVALQVIFSGAAVLESVEAAFGQSYLLPEGVESHCDSGKAYHFWLPAYLTWSAVQQGATPEIARTASYIASVGYQMKSKTWGRDPIRPFTVRSGRRPFAPVTGSAV